MFLPDELERDEAVFDVAQSTPTANRRWAAELAQYEPVLDALEISRAAYKIGNSATALGVILTVFESHRDKLIEGWHDPASSEPARGGTAPWRQGSACGMSRWRRATMVRPRSTVWWGPVVCRRASLGAPLRCWSTGSRSVGAACSPTASRRALLTQIRLSDPPGTLDVRAERGRGQ